MQLDMNFGSTGFVQARSEFQRAHASATFRSAVNRLLRRCYSLCTLADATAEAGLPATGSSSPGGPARPAALMSGPVKLINVPLAHIVGSLDRAGDYTADFLPRLRGDEERWARVRLAVDSLEGVPPIELYEFDGEYYVRDGHHRVSVMKRMGLRSIEAYVTTLVPVA